MGEKEQDHWEKVQQYTKFEIGRKMSKNTGLFSEREIEEGEINIKNTTIMRILIKWCEELESNLQERNLYQKEEQFRMQDGN